VECDNCIKKLKYLAFLHLVSSLWERPEQWSDWSDFSRSNMKPRVELTARLVLFRQGNLWETSKCLAFASQVHSVSSWSINPTERRSSHRLHYQTKYLPWRWGGVQEQCMKRTTPVSKCTFFVCISIREMHAGKWIISINIYILKIILVHYYKMHCTFVYL